MPSRYPAETFSTEISLLKNLAKTSNFKVSVEELRYSMDKNGLESDFESVIEASRGIFRKTAEQVQSQVNKSRECLIFRS